jgi:hypothetical protein
VGVRSQNAGQQVDGQPLPESAPPGVAPPRVAEVIRRDEQRAGEAVLIPEGQLDRALAHHDTEPTVRRRNAYRVRVGELEAELEAALRYSWPLVVIPCGGAKLTGNHRASQLYVGSYHAMCKKAALRLTVPSRVRILSAKYGLLELGDTVESYDLRMGQPGSVTVATLVAQAAGLSGPVVILAGKVYARAALAVWPEAATR